MPTIQGTTGPSAGAGNGTQQDVRLSRLGAAHVANAHGDRREATTNGRVFVACTNTTGVAPGTAFSTTPPFSLYCPSNATVKLSVLEVKVTYVSGTLGSGVISYGFVTGQTATPTTGTVITPVCTALTGATAQGLARQGSTHVGAPVLLEAAGTMTPALATSVINFEVLIQDFVNGKYEVPPGVAFAIQSDAAAAGTSPLLRFAVTWEEILI